MVNTVSPASPEEFRNLIEAAVEEAVDRRFQELLGDPDEGMEVREEIITQLKEQQRRIAAGERGKPMGEVARELGFA